MDKIPKLILPLLLIAAAFFGFKKCAASRPEPKTKPVKEVVTTVEIFETSPEVHSPPVETFGTVQPYFESTLTPQISGLIVRVAPEFRVGEIVRKGLPLIDIDDRSYKSLLIQQEANLAKAELAYAEEKTQAEQAREDWLESGRKVEDASEFVLRIPQITSALAEIESMKASVRKAKADLARTQIFAPFDAIVTSRTASLGNLASEQQPIGSLVAIEKAEVRLPLNPDQLVRVDLSSPVDVVLRSPARPGLEWQGTIVRTDPSLTGNQTTIAIAEVTSPFSEGQTPLSIGLFVNATVTATDLPPSLKVPESAFVNDSFLWALDDEERLLQLPAKRLAASGRDIFLKISDHQSEPPFRIVSRPLATFQSGQKVTPSSP
ncbi:MAG: efflux RND transporter periplasmic adaptor subunit [Akkermansiaceae bacterium]|nr:efflux RND transporter periplasmic adaptor subunit [Akkermansiaceae bacterium]